MSRFPAKVTNYLAVYYLALGWRWQGGFVFQKKCNLFETRALSFVNVGMRRVR
jgi:hypothetical protein